MKGRWAKWINAAALGASLLLVAAFLWKSGPDLRRINWIGLLPHIGVGLLLYGVSLGAQGVVWIWVVSDIAGISWSTWDVVTYFETHLMRRLPGAPWYIASRALRYKGRGSDGSGAALAASGLEWVGTFATATVWIVGGRWGWGWSVVPLALIAAFFIGLPRWSQSGRWPKALTHLRRISPRCLYGALGIYTSVWFIAALMLWLLARGIAPEVMVDLGYLAAVWALSATISLLTVFVPAGLGVRELTLVAQLQPLMGVTASALAALMMRVVFTVGDLLYLALVSLIRTFQQRGGPG
jgi:hypothetical protein